jgi:5-methylcytosine-specific restriction endonuclease McrA
VSGCRGCLGRIVLLVLLTWVIGELAKVSGWSDTTTGSIFLVVLGLLAIRGSARGRISRAARVTRGPVTLPSGQNHFGATHRTDRSRDPYLPRRERTPARYATGRARDPLPAQLRFRILARDGFRCRYCGRQGSTPGVVLHVDHVVPLAVGGTSREDNLRTACEECNLGKGTRAVVASDL